MIAEAALADLAAQPVSLGGRGARATRGVASRFKRNYSLDLGAPCDIARRLEGETTVFRLPTQTPLANAYDRQVEGVSLRAWEVGSN